MEISSGINNPVNMYTSNTGNTINLAIEGENKLYGENAVSSGFLLKEANSKVTSPVKKRRKNRRLNTIDSDFLPDEAIENSISENPNNFFVEKKNNIDKIKKKLSNFITSVPLVNIFYLKHKEKEIQKTVEKLNDIIQNADELMNLAVPYGEDGKVYQNIAQNLTDAANVIGKANKKF